MVVVGKRGRRGWVRPTGVSERKKAYLAYIRSPAWRAVRAAWWQEYDRRHPVRMCYCCGRPQSELKRSLELHHRTYERIGAEAYDDLVAVCGDRCHPWITKQWRSRGRTGLSMTLWELTDERRRRMRQYQEKKRGTAGGR